MKLDFPFVPFPREIWTDAIDLSQAEFRLLGWFCCNLKLGIQQREFNDEHILKGVVLVGHSYPPVGLSRNSMQRARTLLVEKNLLVANQVSGGGGRGKVATWSYSLNLSDSDENSNKPLRDGHYTSQALTLNLSDSDNVIRNIEKPEEAESSLTSSEPTNSNRKNKSKPDPRHGLFKELIFRCYRHLNNANDPPWGPADAKQLSALLKETPRLTEQQFHTWLLNYAKSADITPSARPSSFLSRISNYGSGPRDEWHRVKRQTIIDDGPSPGELQRQALAEENRRKGLT